MSRVVCYVSSPLGFTEPGRHYNEFALLPALRAIVQPIDPWDSTSTDQVVQAEGRTALREHWLRVGDRNFDAVASSDLLVAVLDGQDVDSGTAVELGFALAHGIPCFGLRTDLRQAGEEGMVVNLQVEAAIVRSGGEIAPTLVRLVEMLTRRITGRG